jgi:hypothetical protein
MDVSITDFKLVVSEDADYADSGWFSLRIGHFKVTVDTNGYNDFSGNIPLGPFIERAYRIALNNKMRHGETVILKEQAGGATYITVQYWDDQSANAETVPSPFDLEQEIDKAKRTYVELVRSHERAADLAREEAKRYKDSHDLIAPTLNTLMQSNINLKAEVKRLNDLVETYRKQLKGDQL